MIVSGRKPDRWGKPVGEPAGFYDAKAYLDHLFAALRVSPEYRDAVEFAYLPGHTAAVFVAGGRVGSVGLVHPRVAAAFDIDDDVAMFELDLEALLPHVGDVVHYAPVSPYPAVEQDLAIIVSQGVTAAAALELIERSDLVRSASIFDVYAGPPVPKGKKSLAFSISFQSPKKTLTDADASREREQIIGRLRKDLGAELRG